MANNALQLMICYFGDDARRINHAIKVFGFAQTIAKAENLSNEKKYIVELAAIFHDIGIHEAERKYNSSAGKYQEIEGPAIAKQLLQELAIDHEVIDRVCFLVGNHHTYTKIDDIDFQILVEADFIVNIYEDEMPVSSIESVLEKYFKTESGREIIQSMYLSKTK